MKQMTLSATKNSDEKINSKSLANSLQFLIEDSAHAWNISRHKLIALVTIPVFVLMVGVITGLLGKDVYKWFTGEDRVAENLQVLFWAISFVLGLIIVQSQWREGDNLYAVLYGLLCLGIFFIIGEEVSWGQRIFGWATPDSMKVINKQDETNIHNIHGIGHTIKWLHLVLGAYGTILPVVAYFSSLRKRFSRMVSMLVPHYSLIPFFVVPFVWRVYRNFFEAPKDYYFAISEFSEVVEIVIALAFVFFLIFQLKQIKLRLTQSGDFNGKKRLR
ncbi:MAG: hypothetical protein ACE5HS_11365 [bacterium]